MGMRANTNRTAALDFGKLADHYDAGRVAQTPEFVRQATARLGISASTRLLEVGAGTGQLTGTLLAAGGDVVAVEPAQPLAERLKRNYASYVASGRLRICTQLFETLRPADFEPFPQIWSSDAWHWVDPAAGYRRAAELLAPEGLLICTWRFPVLTDPDLQRRLNLVYSRLNPDLVRDPEAHVAELEPLLEEGRREVSESGYMATIDHWTQEQHIEMSVDSYVGFQLSFAQIAALSTGQRAELADDIRDAAGAGGRATISLTIWQYTVASRRLSRAS
jgi:SAM-dependent methyltransferase